MSRPPDLLQGTLDLLVLRILALEPAHGWAIAHQLREASGDVLQVSEGSLYPALHKLEQRRWIASRWRQTAHHRRAKFYALTRVGRRQLDRETDNWHRLSDAVTRVVHLPARQRERRTGSG